MNTQPITREQWLNHATEIIRTAVADVGVTVPPVKVSCSWPGGGSARKRIGECWSRAASSAGINEIFISPRIEESEKVVAILAHELAHAVDDCKSSHGAGFVAVGRRMGLEGKPTQMEPIERLRVDWTAEVVRLHGEFPHSKLDKALSPVKKQTTRMIKCECMACGSIWRMSQSVIDRVDGSMSCPVCHEHDGNVAVGG